ncbi:hypothetical protein GCM10022416_11030 [Actinomadura keratinilytica]|uniref:Uncharacterized protein n=1 Tax=Actinomadura keratinilytica TaxID=547461 RepID=A0ABP7Y7N5_9ACTN
MVGQQGRAVTKVHKWNLKARCVHHGDEGRRAPRRRTADTADGIAHSIASGGGIDSADTRET